ncbi:MAG: cytidylate kinase family protein [Treponema sp.]|nr:cytidylate kinase family protein [Treponema sp.]
MSNNEKIKDAKIAISGKSGCGNTTVSRIVADVLGCRFINFTFRSLAQERGLDFKEVLALASKDDWWDREVDTRQVELARGKGGCVLGSRLAIWMLPEADLKVFLAARHETRARRIQAREGGELEKIAEFTACRDKQDGERYMRIYNIDTNNYSFADLVIDTDDIGPQEIAGLIIAEMEKKLSPR